MWVCSLCLLATNKCRPWQPSFVVKQYMILVLIYTKGCLAVVMQKVLVLHNSPKDYPYCWHMELIRM